MADDPIVVRGGNSVEIDFNDGYTDNGSGNGRKKLKHKDHKLRRLLVNGNEVAKLNDTDKISIVCDDGKP